MRWRLALVVVGVLVAGLVVGVLGTRGGEDPSRTSSATAPAPDPLPAGRTISLPARATGRRVPKGFLGLSLEFQAVRTYTGADPRHINPVLTQLIRNLSPGQAPELRIGGDSTDISYAADGGIRPPYIGYPLTRSWMATTGALARTLGARMIMGVNLAADDPALAAAQARDYVRAMGSGAIEALEIGNEPNVYGKLTAFPTPGGGRLPARPSTYGYPAFRGEFESIADALPALDLAGPALAAGPEPKQGSWISTMSNFLFSQPRVRIMSVHRYPLRNCYVPPSNEQYPTIAHLLAPYATTGLAASVRRWLHAAHAQHRPLRIDELNSVACRGKHGVSDTFASSLWAPDALFSLLRAGVDGVNIHTLPDSAYELFQFSRRGGHWSAWVRPVYYGLQLFAEATPPGSRLFALGGLKGLHGALSVWATRSSDGTARVLLINKHPHGPVTIALRPPPGTPGGAELERMRAPNVHSGHVSLGGRTYGGETETGRLAPAVTQLVEPQGGAYRIRMPGASAALVTFHPR